MVQVAKATWFVVSDENQPMGQVSKEAADAVPTVGGAVAGLNEGKQGTVLEFNELAPSCGARRFKVVVKALS